MSVKNKLVYTSSLHVLDSMNKELHKLGKLYSVNQVYRQIMPSSASASDGALEPAWHLRVHTTETALEFFA